MSLPKIKFDKTLLERLVGERNPINEEESIKQSDSGSPSQMSSGESDPEAKQEKQLKHEPEAVKVITTPQETIESAKSIWVTTSDQKNQKTNSSFVESDNMTQYSGYAYDAETQSYSSSSQMADYGQVYQPYCYQPQYSQQFFMDKKSFSSQTLPKKKLNFNQNNSFSNEFTYPEALYTPYTPFQQQQVRKRQFAPQIEMTRFQIYLDRIEQDGRTTLMIRNIPNKYTQPLILEDVNINHFDKYDFFYLPIDFTNKCNVGYAFINFSDVKHIKDFFIQYHGQRWKMFNSEKVCQITYARIQGRDELLKHFQFSSIINLKDKKMKPVFFDKISQIVQQQKQFITN